MGELTLGHFVGLSAILFALGLYCVLTRRNAIGILMGIELILNSANVNYVAFARYGNGGYDGQVFAIFVIMLAAAEAAPSTYGIGHAFLTDFVLPFEVASIVLLAALVGAIVVSRKEVKA